MLTTHLDLILLIAAIIIGATTITLWQTIGQWARVAGIVATVVLVLSVNYDRL